MSIIASLEVGVKICENAEGEKSDQLFLLFAFSF
jgi:hypothetical protein